MTSGFSKLTQLELPLLDPMRCNGCSDCIVVCPTACLELFWSLPALVRPGDCVSCGLCAAVCPTQAFTMTAERIETTRGGPFGPPLP